MNASSKIEMPPNVYRKLNQARTQFHALAVKKTGKSARARSGYFELADFIVPALGVFADVGLTGIVYFANGEAILDVINVDEPEQVIRFSSPMGSASLQGCHEVQNIGAVQTYQRRYLWMMALEIVEHDALDASDDAPAPKAEAEMPDAEWTKLVQLIEASGADRGAMLKHFDVQNLRLLDQGQYASAIEMLNTKLAKKAKEETTSLAKELEDEISF